MLKSIIRLSVSKLRDRGLESLIPLGKLDGEFLDVRLELYSEHLSTRLRSLRQGRPDLLQPPTAAEMASNFMAATARWAAAGFPRVTQPEYEARAAVCDACKYWDVTARGGLGKCNSPGCGCTGMKRWLATEKCPQGKWPKLTL